MNTPEFKIKLDILQARIENEKVETEMLLREWFGGDALIYDCKGGVL